jgi:hypothetical protein
MWTSPDGIDWTQAPDPSGRFEIDPDDVANTSSSIVMSACCIASAGRILMRSADGIVWVDSTPADAGRDPYFHLAAAGDEYLAITSVSPTAGGDTSILAAWRSWDGRTWTRDPALELGLRQVTGVNDVIGARDRFIILDDDSGYHMVAGDGSLVRIDPATTYGGPLGGPAGLIWLGPPDDGPCLAGWFLSGDRWRLLEPAAGGCVSEREVTRRIALRDGWLIVGSGATPAEESVWATRPAGSVPAVDAPAGSTPVPPTFAVPTVPTGSLDVDGPCPAGRPSLNDVVALKAYDRAACFGSSELSFRAWVVDPGEGYGGTCEPLTPRWLYACVLPDWWLAETKTSTTRLDALKRPDAKGDLKGVGRWVAVTGHFDDPAAAMCQLESGPARIGRPPTAWYVLRCREQFAVTRIETTR